MNAILRIGVGSIFSVISGSLVHGTEVLPLIMGVKGGISYNHQFIVLGLEHLTLS
jgi:hypothetical protein